MTELSTLQHNLTDTAQIKSTMALKLPVHRLAPTLTSSLRPTYYFLSSRPITHRTFSYTHTLREAPREKDPKVVYSRPTTLGGADRKSSPLRIWPFVLILAGGFYAFNTLIKERSGTKPADKGPVKTEHPRG